ncbi:hypothetical protein [Yoonia sp. R2-816]|uniref:hypothetical protein n=1 Tax=Yoonia sp. R2-816 TaxID=3342638 RepID=UPI003726E198
MNNTLLRVTSSAIGQPFILFGLVILVLSSCRPAPILSLSPEMEFLPAQMDDFELCESSCGCTQGFSKADEVINLEQTLIYKSSSACNSDGFCETSFVDKQGPKCVFSTFTTRNPTIVSGSLSLALRLNISPEDNATPLLFDAYENDRRTSFVVYESESGLQTTRD